MSNNILKEKFREISNVTYLKPESDRVKTNTELGMGTNTNTNCKQ